ncbi:MAG: hypothetical protein FWG51_05810 [Firmicutes bacterium]|nr:hypothetical protein [Bacillota bacterium]
MLKKLTSLIAAIISVIAVACGFAACDSNNQPDKYLNFIIDTSDVYYNAGSSADFPKIYIQTFDTVSKNKGTPRLLSFEREVKNYVNISFDEDEVIMSTDGYIGDRIYEQKEGEWPITVSLKSTVEKTLGFNFNLDEFDKETFSQKAVNTVAFKIVKQPVDIIDFEVTTLEGVNYVARGGSLILRAGGVEPLNATYSDFDYSLEDEERPGVSLVGREVIISESAPTGTFSVIISTKYNKGAQVVKTFEIWII